VSKGVSVGAGTRPISIFCGKWPVASDKRWDETTLQQITDLAPKSWTRMSALQWAGILGRSCPKRASYHLVKAIDAGRIERRKANGGYEYRGRG
jgi:hypothetical protein